MNSHIFEFVWRVTAVHSITYFICGLVAANLLNYKKNFLLIEYLKPLDSPIITLGSILQIVRGLIIGLILWPFQSIILSGDYGWLKLFLLIFGLSIVSASSPAPGSFEGFIYMKIPFKRQLIGLPEIIVQAFLFSLLFTLWYKYPSWYLNVIAVILLIILAFISIAGFMIYKNKQMTLKKKMRAIFNAKPK